MGLGKRGRLRVDQPTITGELGPAPDAYTHYSPVMIAALSKTAGRSAFDEGGPFFLRQAGGRERAQSHGRRRQHLSACSRGSEPDREQRGSVTPAASNHLDQVFQSSSRSSENFNKSDALVMRLLPETSLGLQTGKSCSEQRRTTLNPAQLHPRLWKLAIAAYPPYAEYQERTARRIRSLLQNGRSEAAAKGGSR